MFAAELQYAPEWPFTDSRPVVSPLVAIDGYPISGDVLRGRTYDPHPTHPFRMGDVLWPLFHKENLS